MDAFVTTVLNVVPHPNADRLVVATVLGYRCITARDTFSVGDKVVYVAPDAAIDVEQPWLDPQVAHYLGKRGRVKNVRLRGLISEGLLFNPSIFTEDQLKAIEDGRSEDVGITHYVSPVDRQGKNAALGNVACNVRSSELPFGLTKTDQENVQQLPRSIIVGKNYVVTKKMDGTSCTIAIQASLTKLENENNFIVDTEGVRWSFDIHVCSRNMDLKTNCFDNVYTTTAMPIASTMCETIADVGKKEGLYVLRGEICGEGINKSPPNKDAVGEPSFHAFEAFFVVDGVRHREDIYFEGACLYNTPACEVFEYVSVTEDNFDAVINKYLDAPAEAFGEGAVFWEVDGEDYLPTGFSFKAKSRDYYAKL